MPGSELWRRVSAKHLTPAPAIWFSVFMAFLALVYSGAYSVVTSLSTIGLYFSYAIPIALKIRMRNSWRPFPGWHLGRHSGWINLLAIGWSAFICLILVMPPNTLSGITIAAATAALTAWYRISERHRFRGPNIGADAIEVSPIPGMPSE